MNLKDETESGSRRSKGVKAMKKEKQSKMKRGMVEKRVVSSDGIGNNNE